MVKAEWVVRSYSKRRYAYEEEEYVSSDPRISEKIEELELEGFTIVQVIDREKEVVVYGRKEHTTHQRVWIAQIATPYRWTGKREVGPFTEKEAEAFSKDTRHVYGCRIMTRWIPSAKENSEEMGIQRFENMESIGMERDSEFMSAEEYWEAQRTFLRNEMNLQEN